MAAADEFELKVFTPAGLLLETRVSSVYLRTVDGEIGILAGHVRYVGLLGAGQLRYAPTIANEKPQDVQIEGGFCKVEGKVCMVLADSARIGEGGVEHSASTALN